MSDMDGNGVMIPRWFLWMQSGLAPMIGAVGLWMGSMLFQLRETTSLQNVKLQTLTEQAIDRKGTIQMLDSRIQKMEIQMAVLVRKLPPIHYTEEEKR